MRRKTSRTAGGFTLIEAAIATGIIGIGITALMASVAAGTRVNDSGQKLTQAVFLAQEIREWTLKLPFRDPDAADAGKPPGSDGTNPQTFVDDLDDLMDVTYTPPRDGAGSSIVDMVGWSQKITLTWRNPNNLAATVAAGASEIINVSVDISYKGQPLLTTSWLVTPRTKDI